MAIDQKNWPNIENLKKHLILALLTFNSLIFGCILPAIVYKKRLEKAGPKRGDFEDNF
jgi:hypothetical protein